MNQDTKTHHNIGHTLFVLGAFVAILGLTILAPMNATITKAFGVSDIIELSNEARKNQSLEPLQINTALMNAAQMKAEDMAEQHYFAHTAPDGSVAWDYFKEASYKYSLAGENLAITNEDAQAVIDGWLNSQTHRDNLLNSKYADFGIGLASFGEYQGHQNTYVIVAFYGKPAATQVLAAVTSPTGVSATLKPRFLASSPVLIGSIAGTLILLGVILESRHLKHLHKLPHFCLKPISTET
jgi:hypothetical protein